MMWGITDKIDFVDRLGLHWRQRWVDKTENDQWSTSTSSMQQPNAAFLFDPISSLIQRSNNPPLVRNVWSITTARADLVFTYLFPTE